MEDEILDYNWVIAHEAPIADDQAELFQQCMNTEALINTCLMLSENNIGYKVVEPEKQLHSILHGIFEVHVEKEQLESAKNLITTYKKQPNNLLLEDQIPNNESRNAAANFWRIMIFLLIIILILLLGFLKSNYYD